VFDTAAADGSLAQFRQPTFAGEVCFMAPYFLYLLVASPTQFAMCLEELNLSAAFLALDHSHSSFSLFIAFNS